MEHFFKPGRLYAVAGASSNPDKFGFKVLQWYKDRKMPVTPINPRKEVILDMQSVDNVKDIKVPEGDAGVGLSVVTPPAITKELLREVGKMNGAVQAVWLQPGTHDEEVISIANKAVPYVIKDCILVNGDRYLSKL